MKLYELANQYKALEQLAESDDLPPEMIADTLEGIEGEFDDKAVACAKMVLSLEANAEAIHAAADAMRDRSGRMKRRADSLRAYLQFQMQSIDRQRIETAELVIARRTNPPAVQVTDEDAIPRTYFVQPPAPPPRLDKKAVVSALKAGTPVPGAFIESSERIEIKL